MHRPHVSGMHGRDSDGAYSIVLAGGYEDDTVRKIYQFLARLGCVFGIFFKILLALKTFLIINYTKMFKS